MWHSHKLRILLKTKRLKRIWGVKVNKKFTGAYNVLLVAKTGGGGCECSRGGASNMKLLVLRAELHMQ